MNFERYSKQQFELRGPNTPAAQKLAEELRVGIHEMIHADVRPAFLSIIEQLNAQGHNLTIYDDVPAGGLSVSDKPLDDRSCLRLACDVVISASHADLLTLSQRARDSISTKLETLWERYIDAIHRFITLNISLIVGLAGFVSFLPKLQGAGASTHLESKSSLFIGLVLLMVSLICEVGLRIWAQLFMEYEILQPKADVDKYFKGQVHYTQSYRLTPGSYAWQSLVVRLLTLIAALCFLAGLSLSLVFLYRNLP